MVFPWVAIIGSQNAMRARKRREKEEEEEEQKQKQKQKQKYEETQEKQINEIDEWLNKK